MNVNKKFDRFKQWAGEKMGGEARTNTSDEFRALEMEMNLRHEGMDKLHKSMSTYVKALTKKPEDAGGEKLPVGYLGGTMIGHGQDFAPDSEFGNCLIQFGRANESIARRQETYSTSATSIWLESLERSLAQMREYQAARKKLEARRLAYDASLGKMQKAKKEDFRVEEDLRAQKAKYEESSEDVFRRMEDIKEAEVESVADLTHFLEAELEYHETCRDIMLELKRNWPAQTAYGDARRMGRARANTAHSFSERLTQTTSREQQSHRGSDEDEAPPVMPARLNTNTSNSSFPRLARTDSLRREAYDSPVSGLSRTNSRQEAPSRPPSTTAAGHAAYGGGGRGGGTASGTASREYSPERRNGGGPLSAAHLDTAPIFVRTPLRPVVANRGQDEYAASPVSLSRQDTPTLTPTTTTTARPGVANRIGSFDSYAGSSGAYGNGNGNGNGAPQVVAAGGVKKVPPPPPPSRVVAGGAGTRKVAPPPPMKRASLSNVSSQ